MVDEIDTSVENQPTITSETTEEQAFNSDSILDSIKKELGILPNYTQFDPELVLHINTALAIVTQLGVGPSEGMFISDNTATWSDYMGDQPILNPVKSYVAKKVKQLWDPPTTGPTAEALERNLSELVWRINVAID